MTFTHAEAQAALEQLKAAFVTAMQAGDATRGAQLAESAAQLAAWIEQGMPGEPPWDTAAATAVAGGTTAALTRSATIPLTADTPLAEEAPRAADRRLAVLTLRLLAAPELPAALRELALEAATLAAFDAPLRDALQAIRLAQDLAESGRVSDIEPAMDRIREVLSACEALGDAAATSLTGDLRRMLKGCEEVQKRASSAQVAQLRQEASDLQKSGLIAGYEQALEKLKQSGNLAVQIGDTSLCQEVEGEYRACHATTESVRQLWAAAQAALDGGRWKEAAVALMQLRDEYALTGDRIAREVERGLAQATCEQARPEIRQLSEEWAQHPSDQALAMRTSQQLHSWLERLRAHQADMDGEQREILAGCEAHLAGLKVPSLYPAPLYPTPSYPTPSPQTTKRQQRDRELHQRVRDLSKQADGLMGSGLVKDIQPAIDKIKEAVNVSKGLNDEAYTRELRDVFHHYFEIQRQVTVFERNLEDFKATQQWKSAAKLLKLGITRSEGSTAPGNGDAHIGGMSWVLSGWETPGELKTEAAFMEQVVEFQYRYKQLATASYKQPLLNGMRQALEQMRALRDRLRPASRKLLDKLEQLYSQSSDGIWKKGRWVQR